MIRLAVVTFYYRSRLDFFAWLLNGTSVVSPLRQSRFAKTLPIAVSCRLMLFLSLIIREGSSLAFLLLLELLSDLAYSSTYLPKT